MFLTSENGFSWIIYCFFRGRQNIVLTMFITKFVVKCCKKFENQLTNKILMCKNVVEKSMEGWSLFSRKILKVGIFYPKCLI